MIRVIIQLSNFRKRIQVQQSLFFVRFPPPVFFRCFIVRDCHKLRSRSRRSYIRRGRYMRHKFIILQLISPRQACLVVGCKLA